MSNRCPKGYSRYIKSKKNIYYNKCCKSGSEPSAEVCLKNQEEEDELNKKLDDEKTVKDTLEKEDKRVASELKALKAEQKRSESASAKAEKSSKASPKKSTVAVEESAAATTATLSTTVYNPFLTKEENEFVIETQQLKKEEEAIKQRALIRMKAAKKQPGYDPMDYYDKIENEEDFINNRLQRELQKKKNNYFASRAVATESTASSSAASAASVASKYDAVIMPPPPPLILKRHLSTNVANQMTGDCFAHSSTRVFLRMISREFFEKHEKDDPFHSIKENACDDLYLIKEPFSVFSEKHDIEKLCKNPGNYNSILMYFFLHKLTIDKFDCQGGMPDFALFYLLRIFNDLKNRKTALSQVCNLGHPKYCEHLQPLIEQFGQIPTKYTASIMHYTHEVMDRAVKTAKQVFDHQNEFFDKIKEIIDLGLYVCLSINATIIKPQIISASSVQLSASSSSSGQMSAFSGYDHAVTIVDYNYSNPANKILKIKNSWGKPERGNDIYIYISKRDLDQSPDQVRIQYLEPIREYSLADLAALDETIFDKLPAAALYDSDDDSVDSVEEYINIFRKWYMIAIIFNSTTTINSFFDKYTIRSMEMEDIMNILINSTSTGAFDKIVSDDILRNVFDCIVVNLKKYCIPDETKYRSWMQLIDKFKRRSSASRVELTNYFEQELTNLFPRTCSASVFGLGLPKSMRHFSRRERLGEGRGKTKKNRQKNNQSKKRRRRRKKRNTKK